MTLITTRCPICGSSTFKPVYPGTLSADDSADPAVYYSSSRVRAGHLPVVRCSQCGLMMTNPRDDGATLARIYGELKDSIYDSEDVNRRRTADAHLKLVMRYQPPARLLDVGCATGAFVCIAQAAGWQVTGLEASTWAAAQARQRCSTSTIVNQLLEDADFPVESFEVVTLWDVLEHVQSPAETLQRLSGWLIPGGWLFLNLPDSESFIARLTGPRWVLLLREHLWYFSPKTIARLLHRHGFEMIRTRPNQVYFSWSNIFGRLAQYESSLKPLAGRLAKAKLLRQLYMRFPMGEMSVVARKVAPG